MTKLFFSILHGCLAAALTIVIAPSLARAQPTLYSVSSNFPDPPALRIVNPANAATISSVAITLPGSTVNTANGLATHPTTRELFALLSIAGDLPCGFTGRKRRLVKINPTTGVATSIGNTGDCFAGLAFHSNGTLYGVTGTGAATPDSLFTINTTTASPTFLLTFDPASCSGCSGEALAFNPNDGLLYRAAGSGPQVLQSVNPTGLVVTNIPLSGDNSDEVTALTHSTGNVLLGADLSLSLFSITTGGVLTLPAATFAELSHVAKGLAFVTVTPPTVTTTAATGVGQTGATLNGTVNPNGATTTAFFQYGLTTGYGLQTGDQGLGAGTTVQAVSAAIGGLQCNTPYHFRAVASNAGGPTNGGDQTFTTAACTVSHIKTFTVPPCRVLDTRIATPSGPIPADGTRSILVAGDLTGGGTVNQGGAANCGVPDAATGVFVNVVGVGAGGPGHLTVYPFNISLPLASTLNFTTGQTIANGVLVPTCTPAGSCAFDLNITMGPASAHVVIDVTGYLALFP